MHRAPTALFQAITCNAKPSYSQRQPTRKMSASAGSDVPTFESIGVKNTTVNSAAGVNLTSHQKLLVGSVLDLFEGKPTLKHLSLWDRNATFADPLTDAVGYDRFAAQWYGLPAVFGRIQLLSHKVVDAGNPIEMELQNKYTAKVVGTTQEISSKVRIHVDAEGKKIEKVEDLWNGKQLPDGFVGEVRTWWCLPLMGRRSFC